MRGRRGAAGLTIVELMVSIAILSVIVGAILVILPGLFRIDKRSGDNQAAVAYARNAMESVRVAWTTPITPFLSSTDRYPVFTAGTLPMNFPVTPATLICAAPAVSSFGTATPTDRRRVTLSCAPTAGGAAVVYVTEVGRP